MIQPPQISMNAPHWSIVNIIDKAKALLNSLFFFWNYLLNSFNRVACISHIFKKVNCLHNIINRTILIGNVHRPWFLPRDSGGWWSLFSPSFSHLRLNIAPWRNWNYIYESNIIMKRALLLYSCYLGNREVFNYWHWEGTR